jgi:hypothetical protein
MVKRQLYIQLLNVGGSRIVFSDALIQEEVFFLFVQFEKATTQTP